MHITVRTYKYINSSQVFIGRSGSNGSAFYRVTCADLSHTSLKYTCASKRGDASSMGISVRCITFVSNQKCIFGIRMDI